MHESAYQHNPVNMLSAMHVKAGRCGMQLVLHADPL